MKNLMTFLLISVFTLNCWATENEKMPEVPWRAIVETYNTRTQVSRHWENDITIKLFGNYSATDSVMVANSIKGLNALCETIQLSFSETDRGNMELYFIDSLNNSNYQHIISLENKEKSTWSYTHLNKYGIGLFKQAYNTHLIPAKFKQNYLTNTLAFALYPVYWRDKKYGKIGDNATNESIFRSASVTKRDKLFLAEMQSFDKKLLHEVYSGNFEEKLEKAKKQYTTYIETPRWLKRNAKAFLLFPFAILLLILFPVFMKIAKGIGQKVPNKFLSFNLNGIIGLIVLVNIVAFYYTLADAIKYDIFDTMVLSRWIIEGFLAALLIGVVAINLLRAIELLIHKNTHKKVLKVVLIFLSTGLIPYLSLFAFALIANRESGKLAFSKKEIEILAYFFIACITVAAFRALISYFFFKEKDLILENENKLSRLRELKTKAELNALHSRINPHFLYNSLNSIAGLVHTDADKTEHMALSLSKLFRYSINKEKSDWTTFKEELEMAKIYLDVEKVRFNERLNYSVEIPEELEEQKIPRFIIQPLVENAVKHGISKSIEGGNIKVNISEEEKTTVITVSDSGQAFPEDLIPGFGIQSIYDKLEILYNNKFEMNFRNTPTKQVILKLKK